MGQTTAPPRWALLGAPPRPSLGSPRAPPFRLVARTPLLLLLPLSPSTLRDGRFGGAPDARAGAGWRADALPRILEPGISRKPAVGSRCGSAPPSRRRRARRHPHRRRRARRHPHRRRRARRHRARRCPAHPCPRHRHCSCRPLGHHCPPLPPPLACRAGRRCHLHCWAAKSFAAC